MSSPSTFTIPRSAVFSEKQMEMVEACLEELVRNTGAWNILLADTTGQLIDFRGRIDKQKAEALAALIAASHAASAEYIKLLGKDAPFVNLSHEADDYSIFSLIVDKALILSITFGNEVKVGIVRVFAEQARRRLSEIIHDASETDSDAKNVKLQLVGENLNHLLDEELDKLTEFEV